MDLMGPSLLVQDVQDKRVVIRAQWERVAGELQDLARQEVIEQAHFEVVQRAQENLDFVLGGLDSQDESPREYAQALVHLITRLTHAGAVLFAMTSIEEMLGLNPAEHSGASHDMAKQRASFFTADGATVDVELFMRHVRTGDTATQASASSALACLLSELGGDFAPLIAHLLEQLDPSRTAPAPPGVAPVAPPAAAAAAMPALCVLLRRAEARGAFAERGGVAAVATLLHRQPHSGSGGAQLLYECCFALWALSFDDTTHDRFLQCGALRVLVDVLTAAPSRKVVRTSVAALRNLSRGERDDLLTEMLTCGLEKLLSNMIHAQAHTQANDPEVESDVRELYEALMRNYKDLSTFDRWAAEVSSGVLRWGIVHTEKFWRENARFVEREDFKLLHQLVALLHSDDRDVLRITLFDIGEFARFYPNGRGLLRSLGAKDTAMDMISHPDGDVAQAALQCVSKLLVSSSNFSLQQK